MGYMRHIVTLNEYFLLFFQLIKPFKPCGAHSYFNGADTTTAGLPCTCTTQPDGTQTINEVGALLAHRLLITQRKDKLSNNFLVYL